MAKRYHQSKKMKHEEAMEEKMHPGMHAKMRKMMKHHSMNPGGRSIHYSELTERYGYEGSPLENMHRKHEMDDFGMIHEDHSAIANLPQDVRYHEWPKAGGYTPEGLDDTVRGINRQLTDDSTRMHSGLKPRKA